MDAERAVEQCCRIILATCNIEQDGTNIIIPDDESDNALVSEYRISVSNASTAYVYQTRTHYNTIEF